MPQIARIQEELRAAGIDGWLLYDFHNRDAIAYHVLGMDYGKFTSRRWFYWIPADGEPLKLAHKVEPTKLDKLPGEKRLYLSWRELHAGLKELLGPARTVAMQYSPLANIPYVSTIDGGTVDLIRSLGYEVVSSAGLVQTFQAVLDEAAYHSHLAAGERVQRIKDEAFALVGERLRAGATLTQYDLQQFIVRRFGEEGMTCMGEYPIVGTNEQPADPHFEPTPANARPIRQGDTLLIDLWAKLDQPGAIFYDITWCGFVGSAPPPKYVEIFHVVRDARDAALAFIRDRYAKGEKLCGWEVDDACRSVVEKAGYGPYFLHRTGHSIGEKVHGNGVNIDNLETRDERELVPGICFSIEPGIYLEGEMAVRSEINVFITPAGKVEVAGAIQRELVLI
ncbi:MAG TPA: Xaa-Pro peptidase family protein [Thermoanaerobaculia bacterium]|nr:Xaa-Pro peptidase family protein [Acidobacteriota bacterium]HRR14038.1 Xaa-Pro peptidase family protein [Thermoanaerobaculia bacterium]HRS35674.1 Xaa-Pro peptidase family protein [Thermoanaerobaculia bacterium]HRU08171.1 Xaa-Pro peptidase family protein [Thermoanaerobaculia bacterium]